MLVQIKEEHIKAISELKAQTKEETDRLQKEKEKLEKTSKEELTKATSE